MVIDARELESRELFLKVRGILAERCGREIDIEVLLSTSRESKKLKAFASMSGCRTSIREKDGFFIAHITGNACCV